MMEQPEGTITYKGNRKSLPGQPSFGPDKAVKKSGEFFAEGKESEKANKKGKSAMAVMKESKAAEPKGIPAEQPKEPRAEVEKK